MFEGTHVAIVTPFQEDGSVDETAFRALIDRLIGDGVDGIVPCGTTGESATLTHAEHDRVVELTIEAVDGRVKVIAGTGSNSTAETIRLTKHARDAGADGALLITPYYNKPTQEGLFRHFETVAGETGLPLVLYNIAGRTARNIEPSTLERLSRVEGIVGVKEASLDLGQVAEIVERCGPSFEVLSGEDGLTLPILAVGGCGVISATANLIPKEMAAVTRRWNAGDVAGARAAQQAIAPIIRACFLETNPVPVKEALAMVGRIPRGDVRLPLCEMSEANRERLRAVLETAGLMP